MQPGKKAELKKASSLPFYIFPFSTLRRFPFTYKTHKIKSHSLHPALSKARPGVSRRFREIWKRPDALQWSACSPHPAGALPAASARAELDGKFKVRVSEDLRREAVPTGWTLLDMMEIFPNYPEGTSVL